MSEKAAGAENAHSMRRACFHNGSLNPKILARNLSGEKFNLVKA